MCGIAGVWNLDISLENILSDQSHRGPDAQGLSVLQLHDGSRLSLGHNRLKIICLSDDANQPLIEGQQDYVLSYNGEIYNYLELRAELAEAGYQFSTRSDSEVLLKALIHWDLDALQKINGMFAFAFFDKKKQRLILARDRFAVKPLYYYSDAKGLAFASSSRSLATQLKLEPNFQYLRKGLDYGIFEDGSSMTAYQDLYYLKAGHYLQINLKGDQTVTEHCYYDFSARVDALSKEIAYLSEGQLQDMVLDRLSQACHLRLRSDVPVALALSGGLDSSIVASLCHKEQPLKAFCFGDPKDAGSEAGLAYQLSQKHKMETVFITPNNSDWQTALENIHRYQEAPVAGLSVLAQYLLYQKIHDERYKVVLGGQGGDEGFLGYRKFQLFFLKQLIHQKQWFQAFKFFVSFSQMLFAERKKMLGYWQVRKKYTANQSLGTALNLSDAPLHLDIGRHASIAHRQIDDINKYSLPTLLRYEDRNSMAHSIESRLPFMDYQLMELAVALPLSMKLNRGYGKWVLRDLMKADIPASIRLARYKRGFDVSQAKSVLSCLSPDIQARLSENQAFYQQFFSGKPADLLSYFSSQNLFHEQKRFAELSVLLWLGEVQ